MEAKEIDHGELFTSTGILRYSHNDEYGYRLVMDVDRDLANYYRGLIPKWIKTNPQKYPPHVSIVRKEVPKNLSVWGKYEGDSVEFTYSNVVHGGTVYYWMNVFSERLEEIRVELGLPVSSQYTLPPEGFVKCFHMTIGNLKGLT
jgi:hypothetical protein